MPQPSRGADGASLHAGADSWRARVPLVNVVDTVGADDASIASLLYSLSQRAGLAPAEHLRFAVAGGAAACQGAGASPPSLAMIEALLPQVPVQGG